MKNKGFTLFELLVVLALFALLLGFFTPLYKKERDHYRLIIIRDKIIHLIEFAKIQSRINGKNLLLTPLCPSKDWSCGMVLSTDNATHQYQKANAIQYLQWKIAPYHLSWQGLQSKEYLVFSPNLSHRILSGSFRIRLNNKIIETISLNRLGRVNLHLSK